MDVQFVPFSNYRPVASLSSVPTDWKILAEKALKRPICIPRVRDIFYTLEQVLRHRMKIFDRSQNARACTWCGVVKAPAEFPFYGNGNAKRDTHCLKCASGTERPCLECRKWCPKVDFSGTRPYCNQCRMRFKGSDGGRAGIEKRKHIKEAVDTISRVLKDEYCSMYCPQCCKIKTLTEFTKRCSTDSQICLDCYKVQRIARRNTLVNRSTETRVQVQKDLFSKGIHCPTCERLVAPTDFHPCNYTVSGLCETCKYCNDEVQKKHKKEYTDLKIELGGKCTQCGLADVSMLELHHPDPSLKSRSPSGRTRSPSNVYHLREEHDRCQLVLLCRIHHRLESSRRKRPLSLSGCKRDRAHEFVVAEKLRRGSCAVCGLVVTRDTVRAFDFDHDDPSQKTEYISQMVMQVWETIDIACELAITTLMCAHVRIVFWLLLAYYVFRLTVLDCADHSVIRNEPIFSKPISMGN